MNSPTILLVEDNESDIFLTTEILTEAGIEYGINVVLDGEQAMDFILKRNKFIGAQTPELIVLDINLPKIDGKEILRFIKSKKQFSTIPVVMYTSSNSAADKTFCADLKADLYIVKADSVEAINNTVNLFKKIIFNSISSYSPYFEVI